MRSSHKNFVHPEEIRALINQHNLDPESISDCIHSGLEAYRAHFDLVKDILPPEEVTRMEDTIRETSLLLALFRDGYFSN